jgi:hypothetical protein
VLVPEPVWLRSGTGLPGLLVRGLLAGPSSALGHVAANAVPGSAETVSTVMSDAGVVEVRLPASASALDQDQRDLLSAQLVWTLQQAPGVEGVRVLAGETPLGEEGDLGVQPVGSWQSFDPRIPASRSQLLALRRGRLVAVSEEGVSEFSGGFGESAQGIGPFDVDLDLTRIAALSADGSRLLVGERALRRRSPTRRPGTSGTTCSDPPGTATDSCGWSTATVPRPSCWSSTRMARARSGRGCWRTPGSCRTR